MSREMLTTLETVSTLYSCPVHKRNIISDWQRCVLYKYWKTNPAQRGTISLFTRHTKIGTGNIVSW